ncbi:winged helix-turn-helix domain-containing protein [Aquimarina sp. SS2-1]|uniref:winged helix-turn-helix domain-containing protein n=1 Tax=Aquimarina besae TaxID=3342247 RepID=UPI0036717A73
MKNRVQILATITIVLIVFLVIYGFSSKEVSFYPEKTKVALRIAGNKLLLANNDTTSLVLPIKEISNHTYELSFQTEIFIDPEILVQVIDTEFKKAGLSENYITELIDCKTNEVSYSYQMLGPVQENEIPCIGRNFPKSCYAIRVIVLDQNTTSLYGNLGNPYTLSLIILIIALLTFTAFLKKKSEQNPARTYSDYLSIGTLKFYPDQLKLSNGQNEISLTTKESELLAIFVQYPNQIVKREQLLKQVWEDQGVIVGRSLDMFISKLRKKLGKDSGVKITNVHGVGYRLEIHS